MAARGQGAGGQGRQVEAVSWLRALKLNFLCGTILFGWIVPFFVVGKRKPVDVRTKTLDSRVRGNDTGDRDAI